MTRYEPLPVEVLLAKGACCGSGCRNCPYEPRHQEGATAIYDQGGRDAEWEGWPAPPRTEGLWSDRIKRS